MTRAALALCAVLYAGNAYAEPFTYLPSGDLVPGSGEGRMDDKVYAPGIRFPIETPPAFANSQVWGHGGSNGPGGGQCDIENFSYPWRDNFCETRSWTMPLCPAGVGHQGQDIRAATCDPDVHWAVAAANGTITNVGSYSVYLTAEDGTRYDYLHMASVQVGVGDTVAVGDHMGRVANVFGGTPTTVHLHFNIRQNVSGVGNVFVPPYMSIITAYAAMLDAPPVGNLDEASCKAIRGWAFEPDALEAPVTVNLSFDGAIHPASADFYRDDLCENLGNCNHGFWRPAPLSLFDGTSVEVRALVDYGMEGVELAQSPATMQCEPIEPSGALRPVSDAAFAAWAFDSFWDEAPVDASALAALPRGEAWAEAPALAGDGTELWVIVGGVRRLVTSEESALAWRLDASTAQVDPAQWPEGDPLPERPVLLRDGTGLYLMDTDPGSSVTPPGEEGDPTIAAEASAGCSCRTAGPNRGASIAALALVLALLRRRRNGGV